MSRNKQPPDPDLERKRRCYALIAEWYAFGRSSGDLSAWRRSFYPLAQPHVRMMFILSQIGIAEQLPNGCFRYKCRGGDAFVVAFRNAHKGAPFAEVLEAFMKIAVEFGGAEERLNRPFDVHDNVRALFEELVELGYARRSDAKYAWTDNLRPTMERIYFGLYDEGLIRVRRRKPEKPFGERC